MNDQNQLQVPQPIQPSQSSVDSNATASSSPRQKSLNPLLFVLLTIALIAAGYFAYSYYQIKPSSQPQTEQTSVVLPSPAPTDYSSPTNMPELTYEQSQLAGGSPVINFNPPLEDIEFDDRRTDIQTKVISPMVEYYANPSTGESLKSITVSLNQEISSKAEYPYSLHAEFKQGAVMDQLLLMNAGELDWWIPTCMGSCPYSPEFAEKYPQIVAQTN